MEKNITAVQAFIAKKAEIDSILERLQALSADHFYTDPDLVGWDNVGNLNNVSEQLKEISDRLFKEGEYA